MNKDIDNIKKTRLFLLNAINDLPADQLNEIPAGFNNNIIWNLGHMIAAQQSICYIRAGVLPVVEKKYITEYKPGTKPGQDVDEAIVFLPYHEGLHSGIIITLKKLVSKQKMISDL